jgi:glycine/sarcosine N-methyltransferase
LKTSEVLPCGSDPQRAIGGIWRRKMVGDLFADLADIYESMIDWPKRLAHEEPFYRRLFSRIGVRRVLDVACGTGRHAAMFHSWQLRVEGADISPGMIARASAAFREPDGLRWVVRGFDQPVESAEPFDAAICVGNSLALAPDAIAVGRAIREMLAAVRPGGVVVVQVLNLWHLPDGPCVWQKCRRAASARGEILVVKGVHRCGPRGFVELILASLSDDRFVHSESVPFLGLEPDALEQMAVRCGVNRLEFFGGYRDQPYDRQESPDLVMVAEK